MLLLKVFVWLLGREGTGRLWRQFIADSSKLNQCVALELKAHSCKLKGWAGKLGGYKAGRSKLSADYADKL